LALLVALVLLSAACTSHEKKFEENLPAPPSRQAANATRSAQAATDLILLYRSKLISLPPEALAPLAQAAALLFETSGAPGIQQSARVFANTLLEARVRTGGNTAFYRSTSLGRPDIETTILAGDALIDVYQITRDRRYLFAVRDAARTVTDPRLGLIRTRSGYALRTPGNRRLFSVVLTAEAAIFLSRAANVGAVPGVGTPARDAYRFVDANQAAVGRWYLNVGSKTPMDLATWARTLLALASTRSPHNQGILGGGAPALWSAAFTSSGTPRYSSLPDPQNLGLPLSLRLLQRYAGTTRDADLAYGYVLNHLRRDGTVDTAEESNSTAQANFALAFADRAYALQRPDAWDRRLI
jgi:hypothetical protein